MDAILYSWGRSLFFDFNEDVVSFWIKTLEESFFTPMPGKIFPRFLDCTGLSFSET